MANEAANLGVMIVPADEVSAWRMESVRHLPGSENGGRHHLLFRVYFADGSPARDQQIFWDWDGRKPDEEHKPVPLTKPDNEPYFGDLPLWPGQVVHCWVGADPQHSDVVGGLSIDHPGDETGNQDRHHSFEIVWRHAAVSVPPQPAEPTTTTSLPGMGGTVVRVELTEPCAVQIVDHGHEYMVFVTREGVSNG